MKIEVTREPQGFAPVTLTFTAQSEHELKLFQALAQQPCSGPDSLNKFAVDFPGYITVSTDVAGDVLIALRDALKSSGLYVSAV